MLKWVTPRSSASLLTGIVHFDFICVPGTQLGGGGSIIKEKETLKKKKKKKERKGKEITFEELSN